MLLRAACWVALTVFSASEVASEAETTRVLPGESCRESQDVTLEPGQTWHCGVRWRSDRAYLLRIERQSIDVALEILGSDAKSVVKVDAPARRAGPEILVFQPRTAGPHSIVVSALEQSATPRPVILQIRAITEADPNSALMRGLGALTTAASLTEVGADRRLQSLQRAHEYFRAAGARELEAQALFRIAAVHFWLLGDWEKAASAATHASDAFRALNDPVMVSQADVMRAASLIETANTTRRSGGRSAVAAARSPFAEAERLLKGAAAQFHAAAMPFDEAHAINNLGLAHYYQGELDAARAEYSDAARLFARSLETASEATPLQNIAVLDYERGDFDRAAENYAPLLARLRVADDPHAYISILNNLANAQRVLGKLDKAIATYLDALRIAEEYKLSYEEAQSLEGLGSLYWGVGQRERGEVFTERALQLRRSGSDTRGLVRSLVTAGNLRRERGDVRGALDLHVQALERAISAPQKIKVLLAIGQDHVANGAIPAAIEAYETALALDLPEDWPERINLTSAYGYARLRRGDADGRVLMERAIESNRAHGLYDFAARALSLLAEEDYRRGEVERALGNIEKALELFEAERARAVSLDMRAEYVASRAAAFELQAELYMKLSEAASGAKQAQLRERALLASETRRVRALEDFQQMVPAGRNASSAASAQLLQLDQTLSSRRHRLAMVMEQTNPSVESVERLQREIELLRAQLDVVEARDSARASKPLVVKSIAAVRAALDADTLLLTYVTGRDRSWLWSITRENVSVSPMPSSRALEKAARELHASWSTPGRVVDAARELDTSRVLLGPARKDLEKKRSVIVVADGVLRLIPFAALRIERTGVATGQRLIEEHTVSYRPSLTAWKDPGPPARGENRILLVGDPLVPETSSSENTDLLRIAAAPRVRLPGAKREIESIAALARGWQADVLLGSRATKQELLARTLGSYRVLHFATHAQLDVHDPELSSILLSTRDAQGEFSSADLTLREIVGLGLDADSVVLSACEGSMGKSYQGQLTFGLSEAFLLAGARNVLGGLWRVSDASAQQYMEGFYRHYLLEGMTPAAAAQATARVMSHDKVFGHPYFWAAFVLIERPSSG